MSEPNPSDAALLDRLAAGDRTALAEVSRQYVDVVHAAARRQAGGDTHLADDITQAVFLTLCRRAGSLRKGTVLVGWLYTTTRNIAMTARRARMRRDRHERWAATIEPRNDAGASEHDWMLPMLDDALHALPSRDREAVLLRFFNKMAFAEVGQRIGTSEEGARKRVSRAVERLRERFARAGLATATTAAVAAMLTAESAKAAPAATVAAVSSGTVTAGASSLAGATAATVGAPVGAKVAAGILIGFSIVGGVTATAVVIAQRAPTTAASPDVTPAPDARAGSIAASAAGAANGKAYDEESLRQPWFAAFARTYGLNGQVVKQVAPPFIPERLEYYTWASPTQAQAIPDGPTYMIVGRKLNRENWLMGFGGAGGAAGVADLLDHFCGLHPHEYVLPGDFPPRRILQGDWVGDFDAPLKDKLDGIARVLSDRTRSTVTFVREEHEADAVVITDVEPISQAMEVTIDAPEAPGVPSLMTDTSLSNVLDQLSVVSRWPVLDNRDEQARRADQRFVHLKHASSTRELAADQPAPRADVEAIMNRLAKELKLSFKIERRTYTRWVMKRQ